MIKVALIHPSRCRSNLAFKIYNEWIDLAKHPEEIEYIMVVDDDDPTLESYDKELSAVDQNRVGRFIYSVGNTRTIVQAVNRAASLISATTELIIGVSDDMGSMKNWDEALFETLRNVDNFKQPRFIGVADGVHPFGAMLYEIVNRAWYNIVGHMICPDYDGVYADDDMRETAYALKSVIPAPHILFEHRHPITGKTSWDVTYARHNKKEGYEKNFQIYQARTKRNFDIPRKADAFNNTLYLSSSEYIKGLTSIVIVTHNRLEYTKKCIKSINRHTPEVHEIIFVDNASTDGTVKWLKSQVNANKNYRLFENKEDVKVIVGRNQGINMSQGEFIALLDSDVVVSDGWLDSMLQCLNSRSDVGIVGPMTNNSNGLQKVRDASYQSADFLDRYAAKFKKQYRYRKIPCHNLSGFCMLFKRVLTAKIGLLDQSFVAGHQFENDDFCLRATLTGFRNVICGDVFVHNYNDRNTAKSHNKTLFEEKWSGIDAASPLGEKIATINAIQNAQALQNRGLPDDAVKTLIARIGFSPDEKILYYYLADILIDEKRFLDGMEAVKEMPDVQCDARYFEVMGYCSEGLNQNSEAEAYVDKALSWNENSPPAINLKGILEYKNGNIEKAVELFNSALDADPGYGEPYTNLGMLSWAADNREEALNLFEKGFVLSPDKGDIITAYHTAISGLNLFNRAETVFREAIRTYPDNKRILFLLIDIFLKQEKFAEAMDEVEKALVHLGVDDGILAAALEIRKKIGPKTIATDARGKKHQKSRTTFSACLIVKNEERHLARCLNSIKPIVDEIIVVDTGSSDRTREIATAFGAKLYDLEWTKDFSAARNYSLTQANGDMILVVDADEVISALDYKTFRRIIPHAAARHKAYTFVTRNYVIKTSSSLWQPNDGAYPEEQIGTGWFPSSKVRLFPRSESIRFENPVHELVEKSLERNKIPVEASLVPVHHYGELDEAKGRKKDEEYYELGLKKFAQSAGNSKALYELAVQATELGRWDEALEHWNRVLASGTAPEIVHFNRAYIYMQKNQYAEAHIEAKTAFDIEPGNQAAVLNYAYCEFIIGDIETTRSLLENYILNHSFYPPITGLLSATCLILGNREKWTGLNTILKKKGFNTVEYYNNIAEHLILSENRQRANLLLKAMLETKFFDTQTRALMQRIENRK